MRLRRQRAITTGAVISAILGLAVARRTAAPGLGRIGRAYGYTYRYATRGPEPQRPAGPPRDGSGS